MRHSTIVRLLPALGILAACHPSPAAQATPEPTRIDVHVVARDAKLVGSAVGGAQVTIRDAETGEVMAEGVHEGGTGDTGLIMGARERNGNVFTTPGAAVYTAELALEAPRMITVEAAGPLDFPQARTSAATTLLVMPGEDVTGDGVVLELWGYIVEILGTPAASPSGSGLDLRARVRMLCSCPTQPGGLWDAPAVRARLVAPNGTIVAETALEYEGGDSTYGGSLALPGTGEYELEVRAVSAETGNTGRVSSAVRVP